MLRRKVLARRRRPRWCWPTATGSRRRGVIDARGPGDLSLLDLGWQKFVGRELTLAEPHGDRAPDGDGRDRRADRRLSLRLLPALRGDADVRRGHLLQRHARPRRRPRWRARIDAYAAAARLAGRRRACARKPGCCRSRWAAISRPIGDRAATGVAKAGMRAGLFHPTTGYSLPDAVRTRRR